MLEKRIVYKVPSDVKKQSIETLKVRKTTLEYLRQNGFKTVEDIIDKQLEIPSEYRGNIYAYLMFGIEDYDHLRARILLVLLMGLKCWKFM